MESNTYSVTLFKGSVSSHGCLDVPAVLHTRRVGSTVGTLRHPWLETEPTVFTAVFVVHGLRFYRLMFGIKDLSFF